MLNRFNNRQIQEHLVSTYGIDAARNILFDLNQYRPCEQSPQQQQMQRERSGYFVIESYNEVSITYTKIPAGGIYKAEHKYTPRKMIVWGGQEQRTQLMDILAKTVSEKFADTIDNLRDCWMCRRTTTHNQPFILNDMDIDLGLYGYNGTIVNDNIVSDIVTDLQRQLCTMHPLREPMRFRTTCGYLYWKVSNNENKLVISITGHNQQEDIRDAVAPHRCLD